MSAKRRTVGWLKDEIYGAEWVDVDLDAGRMSATGDAIGFDPEPYRLHYSLTTGDGYVTSRLDVSVRAAGWYRHLDLRRDETTGWTWRSDWGSSDPDAANPLADPLFDLDSLSTALDCDLGLSPLTNTMPVLRHGMLRGGEPREFLMAWVSVPDLGVHAVRQRYTFLRREGDHAIIRYENADGSFTSDLSFDADGLVVHYPQLTRDLRGP